MYSEIIEFAIIKDKKIYVKFADGKSGLFDMAGYIKSDFFKQLEKETYFRRAFLEFGVITWPNGQDISPSTIELELVPFDLPQNIQLTSEKSTLVS